MATFGLRDAAQLLGVSYDTVVRWAASGRLATVREDRRQVVDGIALAALLEELATTADRTRRRPSTKKATHNQFLGLVTRVVKDSVTAQVGIRSGSHRVVSIMSREAADDLRLEPGVLAIATVHPAAVAVELADRARASKRTSRAVQAAEPAPAPSA